MQVKQFMERLLLKISEQLPCRIISDGNNPYLERYYITTRCGVRYYLHRFVASDPDRGLHNHPWRWAVSFILFGSYNELTNYGLKRVRWINFLVGDSFHRVILSGDQRFVWTLFMHKAQRAKGWGFMTMKEGKLSFKEHVYDKDDLGRDEEWWHHAKLGKNTENRFKP